MNKSNRGLLITSSVLLLGAAVVFFPVARTFLFAATVAVVLVPPMTRVREFLWSGDGSSRGRTLLALTFTALALTGIMLATGMVVVVFIRNFQVLEQFGTQVAARLQHMATNLLGAQVDLQAQAGKSLNQLLGYVQGTFVATAGVLVEIIIFSSALYLFLRHGEGIRDAVRGALPEADRRTFDRLAEVTHSSLYAIYVVHLFTVIITVALAVPFFYLIGYQDHLLFWSFLCGVFQLIPVLGPSLIMIGIAIFSFAQGDNTTGVLVLAVGYPVVGGLPDLLFRPLLLRAEMKTDAAILITGFFAGIVSMGMIGFVLGPLLLKLLVESLSLTRDALVD